MYWLPNVIFCSAAVCTPKLLVSNSREAKVSQKNYAHRQRLRELKGRKPRPKRLYALEPHDHGGFVLS